MKIALEELPARDNQHYLAHDELVVASPREQAEEVEAWLVKAMVDGMEEVLNSGPGTDHPERVPVKVEVEVVDSWGD